MQGASPRALIMTPSALSDLQITKVKHGIFSVRDPHESVYLVLKIEQYVQSDAFD